VSWVKRLPGALPLPAISRSDADFAFLGVEFLTSAEGIRVHELIELFDKVCGGPQGDRGGEGGAGATAGARAAATGSWCAAGALRRGLSPTWPALRHAPASCAGRLPAA
jgi:hypothetical protein